MTTSLKLPIQLGDAVEHRGVVIVPLFPRTDPRAEYLTLEQAVQLGFHVTELDAAGSVPELLAKNPLDANVLLYDAEELLGAKQNRIVQRSVLVGAKTTLKIPVNCVERGRWSSGGGRFTPAPQAAYPELRRAKHANLGVASQAQVWDSVAAKAARLTAASPTGAADAIYRSRGATLDEYLQALPRVDGQSGVLVGIAGRLVCLDYVGRSDVFAGLYFKLLRGYALDAIESPVEKPLRKQSIGRFLGELELAQRTVRPAIGLGDEGRLTEYALGSELVVDGEVVALTAFPARP